MEHREIIEGLMLKLADENINVTVLVKRIGMKGYKKFSAAMDEAFKVIEEN